MTVEAAGSTALDELTYREIQSKLKLLGLPAKGCVPCLLIWIIVKIKSARRTARSMS